MSELDNDIKEKIFLPKRRRSNFNGKYKIFEEESKDDENFFKKISFAQRCLYQY